MTDVDITADLTDGSFDNGTSPALGDASPSVQGAGDGVPVAPKGTQPVHGREAQHVNSDPLSFNKTDPKPEPSLRDLLSSGFKGTDGKPTDQANATSNTGTPPAPALTQDADGKYRNADGTFANAEQIAAFTAAQQGAQSGTQQQADPYASADWLRGFTPAEMQQFQSLPAELRQFVGRTMEDMNTRAQRYGEYDLIEQQFFAPRRQAWQQAGMNPTAALNQLFAVSDYAGRDPGSFVLWFSDQHGLDLDALLDARDAENANVDPAVRELREQVRQLQSHIGTQQTSQQTQADEQRKQAITNFALEKDASGALVRPHLTEVHDIWAQEIGKLRTANPNMPDAEVLQKAYDNACWLTPSVRQKMQEAANTQRQQQEADRVRAAAAAGSSVSGGPSSGGGGSSNNPNRTLREELQEQFAAARA